MLTGTESVHGVIIMEISLIPREYIPRRWFTDVSVGIF